MAGENAFIGVGAIIGAMLNIRTVNQYIRKEGALSSVPRISKLASLSLIVGSFLSFVYFQLLAFSVEDVNWMVITLVTIFLAAGMLLLQKWTRNTRLTAFANSVTHFKVVEKYSDEPKWATYLYFNDGEEQWNRTIEGSAFARDSENDLTLVHSSRERALDYAQMMFPKASEIDRADPF